MFKNRKGQPLVAVAGGSSKGMEIWNPEGKKYFCHILPVFLLTILDVEP
jgi:hypothetical protein